MRKIALQLWRASLTARCAIELGPEAFAERREDVEPQALRWQHVRTLCQDAGARAFPHAAFQNAQYPELVLREMRAQPFLVGHVACGR